MQILITQKTKDYELLDSGNGQKLERYGNYVLCRPENEAIWDKKLKEEVWQKADAVFTHGQKAGRWKMNAEIDKNFFIQLNNYNFKLELLPSKHLGVFPEQSENWKWLESKIIEERNSGKNISMLNLFAYSGGASMAGSSAGATVTHVDSSKFAVDLARENFNNSNLKLNGVRFILEDVRKFVEREVRRGSKYDVIVLDPPVYGRAGKNDVWRIEEDILPLIKNLKKIISSNPTAILINGYASVYSSVAYSQILDELAPNTFGKKEFGELAIQESESSRLLPSGIFARWSK